jgi:hypothetical protein
VDQKGGLRQLVRRRQQAFGLDILAYLLILLSIGIASHLHSRPNFNRHSQYNVLLFGAVFLWFSAQLNTLHYFGSKLFLVLGAIFACTILTSLQLIGSLWTHYFERVRATAPPRLLKIAFYWLSSSTPYILIFSVVVKALLWNLGAGQVLAPLAFVGLDMPLTYMLVEYLPPASVCTVLLLRYFLGGQIARWPIISDLLT